MTASPQDRGVWAHLPPRQPAELLSVSPAAKTPPPFLKGDDTRVLTYEGRRETGGGREGKGGKRGKGQRGGGQGEEKRQGKTAKGGGRCQHSII